MSPASVYGEYEAYGRKILIPSCQKFLRKSKFKLEPHTELLTAGVPMKSLKLLSRYIPYGTDRSQERLCQVGAESGAIPGGIAPLGMREHI